MTKVIITTVGTSLLNNLIQKDNERSLGFKINGGDTEDISNGELEEEFTELSEYCKSLIVVKDSGSKKVYYDKDYNLNLNASAEIKSICKIADGVPSTVYLLATDTFMSEYAAEQITKHLHGKKRLTVVNKGRVSKLRINAPEEFEQSGFEELIKMLDSIRQEHQDDEVVLNISGGYKALIPFLTIYAQLKSLPIKYIYENSDEVISIGSINLNFDWAIMEALRPYLVENISSLDLGVKGEQIVKTLRKNYLILSGGEDGEGYSLSPLGKMMVDSFHDKTNLNNKILGTFLEYKYFEYFVNKGTNSQISALEYDLSYSYEFSEDQNTFIYDFLSTNTHQFESKAGDIDLILEKDNEVTLVEVKNFHTLLSYRTFIGNYRPIIEKDNEDYYRKIKAKIEAYFHKKEKLPSKFLFLVNAILFQKDNKEYQTDPALLEVLNHFKQSISLDYSNKITFEAKVCRFNYVDSKKLKVNYNKLLRNPIKESSFHNVNLS